MQWLIEQLLKAEFLGWYLSSATSKLLLVVVVFVVGGGGDRGMLAWKSGKEITFEM